MHGGQLMQVDALFMELAKRYRVKFVRDYRGIPSCSLLWWDKGAVKFIQLRMTVARNLELWIAGYRLALPLLNFWTTYLDVPSDFSKKITELQQPIDKDQLQQLLIDAKGELDSIERKRFGKGQVSLTVLRNFILPPNILSLVLLIGIISIVVYLLIQFVH